MKAKVKGEDVWIGIRSCKMFKNNQLKKTIRFSLSVSKSTVDRPSTVYFKAIFTLLHNKSYPYITY